MNVQKEEKVKDSLELLRRDEEGEIVEDSFDKIQEQEQDDNEEEVSSRVLMDFDWNEDADYDFDLKRGYNCKKTCKNTHRYFDGNFLKKHLKKSGGSKMFFQSRFFF